jgi:MFS family permease
VATAPSKYVRLGLKENLGQFALLILVNAFVGGMVGLERAVVPLVGSQEFGLVLRTAIFSFIVSFGVVKALSNLLSGPLADTIGRKKVLVAGWVVGVPVPFLLMLAPSWRARSLSVYRFWRDLGYAVGALCAGIIADVFGLSWAIGSVGALTFLSGAVVAVSMREKMNEGGGEHRDS